MIKKREIIKKGVDFLLDTTIIVYNSYSEKIVEAS